MVIGYGFRDDHINEIIADAVTNHNLKFRHIAGWRRPGAENCSYGRSGNPTGNSAGRRVPARSAVASFVKGCFALNCHGNAQRLNAPVRVAF
jgi:hypothetical protein